MESTDPKKGLTRQQAEKSRREYGENILTPPKKESVWKLFLEKFDDPVIRILLVAAFLSLGISFVEREFAETIGIFCAILLSTGISFWFEYDAEKKFDLLGKVDDDTLYKVLRDGEVHPIGKKEIVVGDIVFLETGEEIPADGILLESMSLSVNESNLTGEQVVEKSEKEADRDPEATYPTDRLLRGTTVLEGRGTLRITEVGDQTEYGKVARQSTIKPTEKTPLNKQLDRLAKLIGVIGFGLALLTFFSLSLQNLLFSGIRYTFPQVWLLASVFLGLAVMTVKVWLPILYDAFELAGKEKKPPRIVSRGGWIAWIIAGVMIFVIACAVGAFAFGVDPLDARSWITLEDANRFLRYFMVAVTLIVVAVPEGLPMSVTLSLALSMRRMLKTNNLVRKMHACETMGAATVICTDKTGTLTQNKMNVRETAFTALDNQEVKDDAGSGLIVENIALNSTAFLDHTPEGEVKPIGNPTEGALLLWLEEKGKDYRTLRQHLRVIDQMPFHSEKKYMATLVEKGDQKVLYLKGAPEILLSLCGTVTTPRGTEDVANHREEVTRQLADYQGKAMRTLGFAWAETRADSCEEAIHEGGLSFLGIAAIADPVREEVPDAVARCLSAGIDVKMVTGDTPGTAREIGRQIGLWNEENTESDHITGAEFAELPDEELMLRIPHLKIMSRARPTDKQRLVQLLQRSGEVVAVTGDGTNDAPALNFAQVGLSMGSGTSVAKEASDITLLDDSFKSIATAVMWGRSLYKNIQRFILFQLTINFTALVVVFLGSLFGTELPLTVTQMLWVNLIMDTFAAGALASLPPDPKVMLEKPRKPGDFIITPIMARNILTVGGFFIAALLGMLVFYGKNVDAHRLTVFFTTFVLLQVWNMFNARVFGTGGSAFSGLGQCKPFLLVMGLILLGQFIIVQYAGEVFRTVPLPWQDWLRIAAATSVVLWAGEIVRANRRRKMKRSAMV